MRKFEHTEPMERADILAALGTGDLHQFSRVLRSAAMFADPPDLDEILAAAVNAAEDPINWWAISQAIIISTQARGLVPSDADAILAAIEDGSVAAESRDEAREVIEIVRELGVPQPS